MFNPWRIQMKDKFLMLCLKIQSQLVREEGQDLIEYALLIAFVAMAATAGMTSLAASINAAFSTIGTNLTGAMS
jgi:pilus assembly protein Flp/PilA